MHVLRLTRQRFASTETLRVAVGILVLACLPGCMFQTYEGGRAPLYIQGDATIEQTVVASIVTESELCCWIWAMQNRYDAEKVVVDRNPSVQNLEFLDPSKPELPIPEYTQAMVFFLATSKYEGFAIFCPGYTPAVWTYALQHGGGLEHKSEGPPKYPPPPRRWVWAPLANSVFEHTRDDAVSDKPEAPPAGLSYILSKGQFWDALRWRYFWGKNRAEIETICRTVVESADAWDQVHKDHKWTLSQWCSLRWCKEIVASVDAGATP